MDECRQCGRPIHPERVRAIPNVKTCSRECSNEDQRMIKAEYQARLRARRKEERETARASVIA